MSKCPTVVVRTHGKKTGRKARRPIVPRVHQRETRHNQDFMFRHMIDSGRRKVTIQHNGKYNYGVNECPDSFNHGGRGCPRGTKCKFAHATVEISYHPLRYKTRMCLKAGTNECDKGSACAWAHSGSEVRALRNILGANWRLSDPTFEEGERRKRAKTNEPQGSTRIKIKSGNNGASFVWGCGSVAISTSDTATPMRTATPASMRSEPMTISEFSSESSPPREEVKAAEDRRDTEMMNVVPLIREEAARSEFSCWFRSVFNCEDIRLPFVTYLSRFESSKLNDFSFLFELLCDRDNKWKLAEVLIDRIGWHDDPSRDVFERELWQYMRPVDPRAWMARRVNLPQYCEIFGDFSSVYIVAQEGIDDGDLIEMGVSSSGHRTKILYYLEKLLLELEEEDNE